MRNMDNLKTSGRRSFLQKTGAALLAGSIISDLALPKRALASNINTLRVGFIGCGGRGTGAVAQALAADPDTVLTAMGDVFPEQIETAYTELAAMFPDKVKVSKEKKFLGFDAYKKVIESDVDVVVLATPP